MKKTIALLSAVALVASSFTFAAYGGGGWGSTTFFGSSSGGGSSTTTWTSTGGLTSSLQVDECPVCADGSTAHSGTLYDGVCGVCPTGETQVVTTTTPTSNVVANTAGETITTVVTTTTPSTNTDTMVKDDTMDEKPMFSPKEETMVMNLLDQIAAQNASNSAANAGGQGTTTAPSFALPTSLQATGASL